MAPKKIEEATVIILDIGKNVAEPEEKNKKSFFEEARECTARIIERKIMSQGKSLLGIILLGSKKTANSMADQCPGAFRRIEMLTDLQEPNWNMIRDLPEQPGNAKGDWLDALVVAADHFKNGISNVKILSKKVLLMTNFKTNSELENTDVEQVLNGYKEDQFEVDILGPDIYDENTKYYNIDWAKQFVEGTGGATLPFDATMQYLTFHRKKVVNPMPWNVDLSIGPNVKIPVSAYIKLRDEPVVSKWLKAVRDPVTTGASASEAILKSKVHINMENQAVVDDTNVIKSYQYGQQCIPFTEHDKSMLYASGDKCLSVYGFTHATNVTWQNLNGDGLFYVFARKGDKKANKALRCLVECLHEQNLVGIVRRVYNKNNAPKMFALMPVIDTENFVCLSMVGICFKEEIKNMAFPPTNLKKYSCTDEQINGFKDLIKAMDLTKAYDDTYDDSEAFPVAEMVSPSVQYVLDSIAYRAMNPGKPLPQPREEIMSLFKLPPLIEKNSREPLEKLKKLFTLTKVEVKSRSKKNEIDSNETIMKNDNGSTDAQANDIADLDLPKIQLPVIKTEEVTRIGTIEPINDFKTLIEKGKTLSNLTPELADVIESLYYCNLDGIYSKAISTMNFFRSECVKTDPSHYNNWLLKLRKDLTERKKFDILSLITEKQLGFIIKAENSSSTYEADDNCDDSQLYENDTVPNDAEMTIQSEVNDMFDEM